MYVGVDVGGTFTDIAVNLDDGSPLILHKLASTPEEPERAIVDGLRAVLEQCGRPAADVARLAHGTTVGTNALIQRKCGKVALVTSAGFRDLLEIGRQTRPQVYDMHQDYPAPLVSRALRKEVPQRRLANGAVHVPLDEAALSRVASELREQAVDCVVVCFLHSYAFAQDEQRAVQILRSELPDSVTVFSSSSVYPEFREYERFSTAVLNGALITIIGSYLDRLSSRVAAMGVESDIKIAQSSGGLMSVQMARQFPVRASLSGPAAGVQGANRRANVAGFPNIITLDVGGTSADVSLLVDGEPVIVSERDLAGFPIRLPALDVNAVGAGGGSIARIDRDGLLKVGPQSAGAVPGPACYALGGDQPTVTDANVVLGRLNSQALLDGRMPIDSTLATNAITALAESIDVSVEEAALGVIRVACATMVKAIRSVSIERGHDPRDFALFVYGGAGPLHAIDVARELAINRVVVPTSPGILCAEGALNASLTTEFVQTALVKLDPAGIDVLRSAQTELGERAKRWFDDEQVVPEKRELKWRIGARYVGQNYELSVPVDLTLPNADLITAIDTEFHRAHEANYGFASQTEVIELVNLSAKLTGQLDVPDLPRLSDATAHESSIQAQSSRQTVFKDSGALTTPVYRREQLMAGQQITGPAIIEQMDATVLVFPADLCEVDAWGNLVIHLKEEI